MGRAWRGGLENLGRVAPRPPKITIGSEEAVLERGPLRVEIALRPFAFTLRRAGRRLLRAGGLWAADGTINDRFIKITEGVFAHEDLLPPERAQRAEVVGTGADRIELHVLLRGGRRARLRMSLPDGRRMAVELEADGPPLRLGIEWDRRSGERACGLGARHGTELDQTGRTIQLGADRRYTGPDCPPDLLAGGGIAQGDCAPVPWFVSSRG